ncbi:MAG: DUF3795 domain-containing protein [Oscillospiraceae bacterium]|nr:DUF3795 domain-containing protein [Oscillospiraceae bacterium]
MNGNISVCGLDCSKCEWNNNCKGCEAIGGKCMIAACCKSRGKERCGSFFASDGSCGMKKQLIAEFNELGIEDMEEVTDLNALSGSFINLEYRLPNGIEVKFWQDDRVYLGNQICKKGSDRCYGLAADEKYLMVCEYGMNGSEAEIVVFKRQDGTKYSC